VINLKRYPNWSKGFGRVGVRNYASSTESLDSITADKRDTCMTYKTMQVAE